LLGDRDHAGAAGVTPRDRQIEKVSIRYWVEPLPLGNGNDFLFLLNARKLLKSRQSARRNFASIGFRFQRSQGRESSSLSIRTNDLELSTGHFSGTLSVGRLSI
jgi:hypothetical protein